MKLWPLNAVFGDKEMPLIQVEYKVQSKDFISVEISSMIRMKKTTSKAYLTHDVQDAVITNCLVDFLCMEFRQPEVECQIMNE